MYIVFLNTFLCVWQVNDEVVVSTSSYNASETEKRLITAVSDDGTVLTLHEPLNYAHIGQFCPPASFISVFSSIRKVFELRGIYLPLLQVRVTPSQAPRCPTLWQLTSPC